MNDKKLNLRLLTRIKQDLDVYTGKKTVRDYLDDPSISSQLSQDDVDNLLQFEESLRQSRLIDAEVEKHGVNLDAVMERGIPNYLKLSLADYKKVIPVLVQWIKDHKDVKWGGLVRTLSTPYAKDQACKLFINEFLDSKDEEDNLDYKWVVGNGLNIFASDDIVDELIPLVVDKKYGRARQMIVLGLGKMKKPENKNKVTGVLIQLLDDEDVAGHAIEALGKLKAVKAKPNLEKFLTHKKTWWRNAAKNALAKINKQNN